MVSPAEERKQHQPLAHSVRCPVRGADELAQLIDKARDTQKGLTYGSHIDRRFRPQVTQLIARRVRESGVYCEIVPFNMPKGV